MDGSSPLARGAHYSFVVVVLVVGLIPAGAGSTQALLPLVAGIPAHPRWRGEHVDRAIHPALVVRLIPAGAGSTRPSGLASSAPAAHPRWRGEHSARLFRGKTFLGSSPLARGAPEREAHQRANHRLIPAGAGSTYLPNQKTPPRPAHPRWRGEHRWLGYRAL